MKQISILSAITCLFIMISCTKNEPSKETEPFISMDSTVNRGAYLVNAIGCRDCHSPKRMGPNGPELIEELDLSGYPSNQPLPKIDKGNLANGWALFSGDLTTAVGPWGQSFSANITSDATGIGNWTEENFLTAIKKGKYKGLEGSRDLLPPMPWMVYKNLSDDDLKAIFAYLQTTKPVKNIPPPPVSPGEIQ